MNLDGKIKEITTAYMIGLGYTVPPYNGSHSKEYFKDLKKLFREEMMACLPEKKTDYAERIDGMPVVENGGWNDAISEAEQNINKLSEEGDR